MFVHSPLNKEHHLFLAGRLVGSLHNNAGLWSAYEYSDALSEGCFTFLSDEVHYFHPVSIRVGILYLRVSGMYPCDC